jgi:hypothetical protein
MIKKGLFKQVMKEKVMNLRDGIQKLMELENEKNLQYLTGR